MIRYQLIDINDNVYDLDDNTFRLLNDSFEVEVDIVERSFRAGADFPGIQRDTSKQLEFNSSLNYSDDASFRLAYNNLTYQFRKTVKIRDIQLNLETDVLYASSTISYDDGGQFRGAGITTIFVQLKPFWEDVTPTIITETGTSTVLEMENNGFVDTPPLITVEAQELITKFSLRIRETGDGIVIKDLQFGTIGLTTYIIDNADGVVELNQINRNEKIQSNTGFFNLQVGANTLDFLANGSVLISLEFRQRYYI